MAQEPIWNQRVFYELLLRLSRNKRWLDVGCGRGVRDPALRRIALRCREAAYFGIDLDMDSLRDNPARQKLRADVTKLPFSDGCFDLVSSNMVFEHLPDPPAALREINRVLADEGMVVIHAASSLHSSLLLGRVLAKLLRQETYLNWVARYTGRKPEDIFPTRYRANTASSFAKAAKRAGLHPVFVSYIPTPYYFPRSLQWIEGAISDALPGPFRGTLLTLSVRLTPNESDSTES